MMLPLSCSSRSMMRSAMTTALVPGRLARASDTAGTVTLPSASRTDVGRAGFAHVGREKNRGHIAHIDRAAIAGGEQDVADVGRRLQRLARHEGDLLAAVAHWPASKERLAPATLPASCCSVMP